MKSVAALAVTALVVLATAGCVESGRGEQVRSLAEKVECPLPPNPDITSTVRIGYQEIPNGDLIVKDTSLLATCLPKANITWSKFASGGDVLQAFRARSLDIALLGSAPAARALSQPLDIDMRVVWIHDVIGKAESLVVHDPAITDIQGLKGKSIAVPFASTSHLSLLTALDRARITGDVRLINTQPDAMLAAWGNGIDAAWVWDPVLSKLAAKGHVIADSAQTAADGSPTFDLEGARSEFVNANGPFLKYWTAAQNWATELIASDPQRAARHIAAQLAVPPDQVVTQLGGYIYPTARQQLDAKYFGGGLSAALLGTATFLNRNNGDVERVSPAERYRAALYPNAIKEVAQ
ncbi:glycine/betaine ABC transporter substrate-binding protein [Mycolicibacterium mucogenicum]|uniref:Glycine/betaine ABC transporter substrate-binding protein n=1 Tax=Mycolicibacterium mucogenicum TaxID=56689 RepID=A0A1A3H7I5_MYCMU|nr:ABC transporter substrate-binding protein [Mycolicibacterium mucogenicum]OBJ44005.1 glycine/betaine ABC transporter substrate-binding protein [Mycolicibacterium mucogenicum]